MKKIISLLVVLAMLMSMAPLAFAAETTEVTEYREVTIPEAIELAEQNDGNKYLVRGTVTEVTNTTYGNLYIEDAEGNTLYVYGVYGVDGVDRYDAMETKPVAGDEVLLLGILTTYNSTPQMKNAWLQELNGEAFEAPETEPDPEADTELTIAEAIALGKSKAHNTYTAGKYYVTGEITEIYNTTYGNMYIQDAEGNTLTIYGTYDADGTNRFDAMENQPAVGDTITVYGIIGQYNGTPQMKNGWIQEEPEVPGVEPTMFLGNNVLTAGRNESSEYVYVAEQTGTLYITLRSYTCNGVEYGEQMLSYGWSELFINGELIDSKQETLEVNAGDILTVQMTCDYDVYEAWLYLSYEGFYEEPVGTKINPIKLDPTDCPTTTVEIPAGEEVWYELSYDFDEHVLFVYGENAYIKYQGWVGSEMGDIYVNPVDGVVSYEIWAYTICIGNNGTEAATFELDCMVPLGASKNPYPIENGEQIVNIVAGRGAQYMAGYAPVTGTLTVTIETEEEGYWSFTLQDEGDPETWEDDIYEYLSNSMEGSNTVTINVKEGDYLTANVRLNDKEWNDCDGTVKVTFVFTAEGEGEGEEPDPSGAQLELGYNSTEVAAGEETAYTWTAENDGLFTVSMMSTNWSYTINGVTYTSADEKPVYMTIIEVAAGDVVTLNVGTADGAAGTVDFSTNAYAVGSPIEIQFIFDEEYTAAAINVAMPAGEYTFSMWNGSGMVLTVDGVETEMTGDGWFDPIVFNVTVAEAGIVEMTLSYAEGSYYNPENLELGYNAADIEEYSQMGYWYTYTAESDCLFALTMYGDNWFYSAMIQRADGTSGYPDGHYSDEMDADGKFINVTMQVLELKAGDVVLLNFGTADYAAATVEFNAMTYTGTEEDPVMMEFVWNDEWTAATLYADLPAGEYVYGARINGMNLLVDGVETEYVPGMGRYPCLFTINNAEAGIVVLEASLPVGSMDNPEVVEDGEYTVEIEPESYTEYWYSYTAPADGQLTITVTSTTGYVFAVNNVTAGLYGDYQWSDEEPINPMTIDVKAGDVVMVMVGAYDPELGMGAGATITVDLRFSEITALEGDVNGDGKVDTTDAKLIMQYDLGLVDETALELAVADVNGDGKVDTTDAKLIMQFDLGLIDEL